MNIKKINWWWLGDGSGGVSISTPEIFANNIYTDKMDLQWSSGADSYVVERATDSGFTTGLTTIYTGSLDEYQDTGLSTGTTYYYRVTATVSGTDSAPGTTSAKTISFSPVAWWEMTGMDYGITNAYGKTTLSNVDNIYSIVNESGIDLNFNVNKGGAVFNDNGNAYSGFTNSNYHYQLSSLMTLSGDFTIAARMKFNSTAPVNHYLFSYTSSAFFWIRFSNISTVQIRISSGPYSCTLPTAPTVNNWFDLVIKRVGTNLFVSSDGGANFSSAVSAVNTAFTLDTAFAADTSNGLVMNGTFKRIVIAAKELNSTELGEVFNFDKSSDLTDSSLIASIDTKQTFSDLSSGYLSDNTINAAGTSGSYRTRVLTLRDKSFVLLHKINNTTYYLEDRLYVFDHATGKISTPVDLGVPENNTDVHNNGSIINYNNALLHFESNKHYDQGETQKLIFKKSWQNFDLSLPFTQINIGKGLPVLIADSAQYHQMLKIGNTLYIIYQEFNGSYAQWVSILISTDGGKSFDKYRVIDSAGASEFVYPQLLYSENKLRIFVGWIAAAGRYRHQTYFESSDGLTWTNLSGSFSQTITANNPINRTNALANARVGVDATALAGNVKIGHAFQDSGGEVFCIQGDGNDTGLNLVRGSSGGSFTSQALNFGVHSIVSTWLASDGDNLPFAVKTGTDAFDIFVHRTNSGNWEIVKFTTTDGGVNCTFDSVISGDATKKHWRMYPAKNLMFADHKLLVAIRNQTTYGDPFFVEI